MDAFSTADTVSVRLTAARDRRLGPPADRRGHHLVRLINALDAARDAEAERAKPAPHAAKSAGTG